MTLARGMSEMATAAKESREEIEGVVVLLPPTSLGMLLEAFMSVFVVYLTRFRVREGFVGRCDLDELVFRRFIATDIG